MSFLFMNLHNTKLKEGDKAPDFSAKDENGKIISLSDFKNKKVVLYFYPKDDTLTCTAQACNIRDNYSTFIRNGFQVLGISADDCQSHKKFIKKYNLPFPLLADENKKIINDYDVWGKKSLFGKSFDGIIRTTFVIDEHGIIEKIIDDIVAKKHSNQILKTTK